MQQCLPVPLLAAKEALELRDNDPKRYGGKGVLKAVHHINRRNFFCFKRQRSRKSKKNVTA